MSDALVLQRDGVLHGQLWRLWSGHLLHLDAAHATLDIAAMALLAMIAWRMRWLGGLLRITPLMMPLLSAGLLLSAPDLQWYAGLSGLLHGWAAWLLLRSRGPLMWIGLALLAAKLAWEQLAPPLVAMPFEVIHLAHLLGALLGTVLAAPAALRDQPADHTVR